MIILYLALCFVILGYLGTALIAWQSIPQRNAITYSALLFVILGAIGATWITIDMSRTSDQLVNKSNTIENLYQKLNSSSIKLQESSQDIAHLNQKIAESQHELFLKSEKIAGLQDNTLKNITGGNSFCYLQVWGINSSGLVETALIHKGNYPLSDLQITFEDSLLRDKILADDISNSKYHYKLSDMDTMFKPAIKRLKLIKSFPTGSSIHNYVTMTLSGDHSYYTLNYWTRNRRFTQILSFRFVLNKWTFATMVVDDKDKELYFDINNDFPISSDGTIQW